MKKLLALLLALSMMLAFVACGNGDAPASGDGGSGGSQSANAGGNGEDDDYYVIGSLLPLTGWEEWYGASTKAMFEIVVDYVNENGGIKNLGGKKLKIIFEDHASDDATAVAAFERLVEVENVDAIWGPYATAQATATQSLADKYEIPYMIIFAYGDEIMQQPTEWAWRPNPTDASSLAMQKEKAEWQSANMEGMEFGEKVALMIYGAEDWGASVYNFYSENPDAAGCSKVYGEAIQPGSADLSTQMNRVMQLDDVDYISAVLGTADTMLFLRQMKEYDINLPMLGTSGFNTPTFFEEAGDIADYTLCESNFFHSMINASYNIDLAQEIDKRFTEAKGHEMDECAANSWMGAMAFIDALERAASDSKEDVNKAISETNILIEDEPDALIFMNQKEIVYEDIEKPDGTTVYHQARQTDGAMAQGIDGAWRVIWPENVADPEYPLVWPVPKWSERG